MIDKLRRKFIWAEYGPADRRAAGGLRGDLGLTNSPQQLRGDQPRSERMLISPMGMRRWTSPRLARRRGGPRAEYPGLQRVAERG